MQIHKHIISFALIFTVLNSSCAVNIMEPSNTKYSNSPGVYSINSVDRITYPGESHYFIVNYTSLDSLNKFETVGEKFNSGFWLAGADHFVSVKHNLYIVSTLSNIYFYDTRTNELVQKIDVPSSIITDSDFSPCINKFITFNNDFVIVAIRNNVYLLDLNSKSIKRRIFEGSNIDDNLQIQQAELTYDQKYLYLITTLTPYNIPQKLYKINLLYDLPLEVALISNDFLEGSFFLGVSKDYVICYNGLKILKFSITNNSLIESKQFDTSLILRSFFSFNSNNELICFKSYPGRFYILDCNDLSFHEYYNFDSMVGCYFQNIRGNILGLVITNENSMNYIIDLTQKEVLYSFANPLGHNLIIKEVPYEKIIF
jgi:hypothetical protein